MRFLGWAAYSAALRARLGPEGAASVSADGGRCVIVARWRCRDEWQPNGNQRQREGVIDDTATSRAGWRCGGVAGGGSSGCCRADRGGVCGARGRALTFWDADQSADRSKSKRVLQIGPPGGRIFQVIAATDGEPAAKSPQAWLQARFLATMAKKETAVIELTDQQRQAVKNGEAVRLPLPEIGEDVVLLRANQYESMRELLEDQAEQRAVLNYAMKQAEKVARENPY
jgi:hypothetical protein